MAWTPRFVICFASAWPTSEGPDVNTDFAHTHDGRTRGAPVKRPVTIRMCGPDDDRALRRLAGRETARPLDGTILAAEVENEPLAAICLETGRVVADPFSRTAGLVDLLRARATQLERAKDPHLLTHGSGRLRRVWAWLRGPAPEVSP